MKQITERQFDLLRLLLEASYSQRELEARTHYSLSTVNRILKEMTDLGYVANGRITDTGCSVMESFRVKRAIFLAAGVGSRLMPITLNTPKPLVRVNGIRMIDGLIDACLNIGIEEIVVVRGYLSEEFDALRYKYPQIRFLENPVFNETENISSALCARYLFSNAYVFEADLVIHDPTVLRKYHYQSDFLGFWVERSDDWCFEVRKNLITMEKFGGFNCYQMVGISYWDEADGRRLADHLQQAYDMPGGKEYFWERVPLDVFQNQYQVRILECRPGDVIEIDLFRELKAIDPSYAVM